MPSSVGRIGFRLFSTAIGCWWNIAILTLGFAVPQLEKALRGVGSPDDELLPAARADFAPLLFNKEIANDTRTNEQ